MPLRASLLLTVPVLLAACGGGTALPPAPAGDLPPSGPAGAYGGQPAQIRPEAFDQAQSPTSAGFPDRPPLEGPPTYDQVGYAVIGDGQILHRSLPPGDLVEVTSLDTGRTVLVAVGGATEGGEEIALSAAAAQALDLPTGARAAVRVRAASTTAADRGALQSGQPFLARADTPPVLLTALRRKLDGGAKPANRPATPANRPAPPPPRRTEVPPAPPAPAQPAVGSGYYVQVAALSDPSRAQSLARSLGGRVVAAGRIHRVRLGPYVDQRGAQAARDAVARRGYGDARIVRE